MDENNNVVEMPMNDPEGPDMTADAAPAPAMEEIPAPTPMTLAGACSALYEHFGISKAGNAVLEVAAELMDVAQEVTRLENIDFTSKAAILRSATSVRATVLTLLKRLTAIRKGGEVTEVTGIDEETKEILSSVTTYPGFMALRDNACENVGEIARKATLATKLKEKEALLAEIAALEKEELEAAATV